MTHGEIRAVAVTASMTATLFTLLRAGGPMAISAAALVVCAVSVVILLILVFTTRRPS